MFLPLVRDVVRVNQDTHLFEEAVCVHSKGRHKKKQLVVDPIRGTIDKGRRPRWQRKRSRDNSRDEDSSDYDTASRYHSTSNQPPRGRGAALHSALGALKSGRFVENAYLSGAFQNSRAPPKKAGLTRDQLEAKHLDILRGVMIIDVGTIDLGSK
ncbi:hypothetical protein VNO78_10660 [Psophocarpus tetragonolobus]|uniref:Uncharacterized protein n=1 Tax=Psophocarpus tetragonolobus TaxID=3891 RepID=A0AAN9SKF3_PSOTE